MICAGSQNSSCSGLVTTAEPPTNGCSGTGAKRQWEPTGEHKGRNIHVYIIRGTK